MKTYQQQNAVESPNYLKPFYFSANYARVGTWFHISNLPPMYTPQELIGVVSFFKDQPDSISLTFCVPPMNDKRQLARQESLQIHKNEAILLEGDCDNPESFSLLRKHGAIKFVPCEKPQFTWNEKSESQLERWGLNAMNYFYYHPDSTFEELGDYLNTVESDQMDSYTKGKVVTNYLLGLGCFLKKIVLADEVAEAIRESSKEG